MPGRVAVVSLHPQGTAGSRTASSFPCRGVRLAHCHPNTMNEAQDASPMCSLFLVVFPETCEVPAQGTGQEWSSATGSGSVTSLDRS